MRYNFRVKHNDFYDVDLVDMKCLDCDHEEEIDLDILLELSDFKSEPSPVITCPFILFSDNTVCSISIPFLNLVKIRTFFSG